MSNLFTRVSGSLSCPPLHHWLYDFPLLYWYGLIIIHSPFLLPYFVSPHPFPNLRSTFYPFPTYWYPLLLWYLFSHHSHISLMVWLLIFLSFRHRHFLWLPLGPWLMRFYLYTLHLIHEGMSLIIGYLSLVSLHYFWFSIGAFHLFKFIKYFILIF